MTYCIMGLLLKGFSVYCKVEFSYDQPYGQIPSKNFSTGKPIPFCCSIIHHEKDQMYQIKLNQTIYIIVLIQIILIACLFHNL